MDETRKKITRMRRCAGRSLANQWFLYGQDEEDVALKNEYFSTLEYSRRTVLLFGLNMHVFLLILCIFRDLLVVFGSLVLVGVYWYLSSRPEKSTSSRYKRESKTLMFVFMMTVSILNALLFIRYGNHAKVYNPAWPFPNAVHYNVPCDQSACSSDPVSETVIYNPNGFFNALLTSTSQLNITCPVNDCFFAGVNNEPVIQGYHNDGTGAIPPVADLERPCVPADPCTGNPIPSTQGSDYPNPGRGLLGGFPNGDTTETFNCPGVSDTVRPGVCTQCTKWFVDRGLVDGPTGCPSIESSTCALCYGAFMFRSGDTPPALLSKHSYAQLSIASLVHLCLSGLLTVLHGIFNLWRSCYKYDRRRRHRRLDKNGFQEPLVEINID